MGENTTTHTEHANASPALDIQMPAVAHVDVTRADLPLVRDVPQITEEDMALFTSLQPALEEMQIVEYMAAEINRPLPEPSAIGGASRALARAVLRYGFGSHEAEEILATSSILTEKMRRKYRDLECEEPDKSVEEYTGEVERDEGVRVKITRGEHYTIPSAYTGSPVKENERLANATDQTVPSLAILLGSEERGRTRWLRRTSRLPAPVLDVVYTADEERRFTRSDRIRLGILLGIGVVAASADIVLTARGGPAIGLSHHANVLHQGLVSRINASATRDSLAPQRIPIQHPKVTLAQPSMLITPEPGKTLYQDMVDAGFKPNQVMPSLDSAVKAASHTGDSARMIGSGREQWPIVNGQSSPGKVLQLIGKFLRRK
jgi:hypothetical protein